jgi:hypothetical protein
MARKRDNDDNGAGQGERVPLSAIRPDERNANKHTERGLKPRPGLAVLNIANCSVRDIEHHGDFSMKQPSFTNQPLNLPYLLLCQFALPVLTTPYFILGWGRVATVPNCVLSVLSGCTPIKVLNSVIGPISVLVAALMTGGTWANKCFNDKAVNGGGNALSVMPYSYVGIPCLYFLWRDFTDWAANSAIYIALFIYEITWVSSLFHEPNYTPNGII